MTSEKIGSGDFGDCGFNSEEKKKAREESKKRFMENGPLGVTLRDHRNVGGSIEPCLAEHPGKTLGEIWSEEEILEYLNNALKGKEAISEMMKDDPDVSSIMDSLKGIGDDETINPINIRKRIQQVKEGGQKSQIAEDILDNFEAEFMRDLKYLESIGKCPKAFQDFKFE